MIMKSDIIEQEEKKLVGVCSDSIETQWQDSHAW